MDLNSKKKKKIGQFADDEVAGVLDFFVFVFVLFCKEEKF